MAVYTYDFDTIQKLLADFLNRNSQLNVDLADNSSLIGQLIKLLAFHQSNQLFYYGYLLNESNFETAVVPENVLILARQLGIVPRLARPARLRLLLNITIPFDVSGYRIKISSQTAIKLSTNNNQLSTISFVPEYDYEIIISDDLITTVKIIDSTTSNVVAVYMLPVVYNSNQNEYRLTIAIDVKQIEYVEQSYSVSLLSDTASLSSPIVIPKPIIGLQLAEDDIQLVCSLKDGSKVEAEQKQFFIELTARKPTYVVDDLSDRFIVYLSRWFTDNADQIESIKIRYGLTYGRSIAINNLLSSGLRLSIPSTVVAGNDSSSASTNSLTYYLQANLIDYTIVDYGINADDVDSIRDKLATVIRGNTNLYTIQDLEALANNDNIFPKLFKQDLVANLVLYFNPLQQYSSDTQILSAVYNHTLDGQKFTLNSYCFWNDTTKQVITSYAELLSGIGSQNRVLASFPLILRYDPTANRIDTVTHNFASLLQPKTVLSTNTILATIIPQKLIQPYGVLVSDLWVLVKDAATLDNIELFVTDIYNQTAIRIASILPIEQISLSDAELYHFKLFLPLIGNTLLVDYGIKLKLQLLKQYQQIPETIESDIVSIADYVTEIDMQFVSATDLSIDSDNYICWTTASDYTISNSIICLQSSSDQSVVAKNPSFDIVLTDTDSERYLNATDGIYVTVNRVDTDGSSQTKQFWLKVLANQTTTITFNNGTSKQYPVVWYTIYDESNSSVGYAVLVPIASNYNLYNPDNPYEVIYQLSTVFDVSQVQIFDALCATVQNFSIRIIDKASGELLAQFDLSQTDIQTQSFKLPIAQIDSNTATRIPLFDYLQLFNSQTISVTEFINQLQQLSAIQNQLSPLYERYWRLYDFCRFGLDISITVKAGSIVSQQLKTILETELRELFNQQYQALLSEKRYSLANLASAVRDTINRIVGADNIVSLQMNLSCLDCSQNDKCQQISTDLLNGQWMLDTNINYSLTDFASYQFIVPIITDLNLTISASSTI